MSAKSNPTDEFEELSRLLDEMNIGNQPVCDDEEITQLLAVATLLKETGTPISPPQHILNQTVDRALAGMQSSQPLNKNFRNWLFSGALGTAASVILVLGLSVFPLWQRQVPVPVLPPLIPTITSEQPYPSLPKPTIEQAPVISEQVPFELSQTVDIVPATVAQPPISDLREPALPITPVPPIELPKPQSTSKNPPLQAEKRLRLDDSKSAHIATNSFLTEYAPPSPTLVALSLPNKKPDLIIADKENGTLIQVYDKGTPQEIKITQRPKGAVLPEKAEHKSSRINQIEVILFDQEVTIEGQQSKQNLVKIADSLQAQ